MDIRPFSGIVTISALYHLRLRVAYRATEIFSWATLVFYHITTFLKKGVMDNVFKNLFSTIFL